MNILITGNLFSLATTLVKEFSRENNKIILASKDAQDIFGGSKNKIIVHSINPAEEIFIDVLSSYKFDVVIFVSTREEQLGSEKNINLGELLDGLKNTLELSKIEDVNRFIYISSTEVYGDLDETSETDDPIPTSINGHTLLAGEEFCNIYHKKYNLNSTIIRVPYIYGPDERTSLIHDLIQQCKKENEILLPTSGDRLCNFLHVNDVSDFIERIIREEYHPEYPKINLSSATNISYYDLADLLKKRFSDLTCKFNEESSIFTRPAEVDSAKTIYDWVDVYEFNDVLSEIEFLPEDALKPQESGLKRIINQIKKAPEIIKWLELILGAALMQFLSEMTGTLIQFKYVDFRLLFVVLMGSVYGIQFGLFAAVLASLSVLFNWYQLGFDWALLTHNVGNWFPFVIYFTAGIALGYRRDKYETEIAYEKGQTELIYGKFDFLYSVFGEIRTLKDEFREQLVGYRGSFGKIFSITRELDTLEEDRVFLKALNILQDFLENNQIAIYSIAENMGYARLEVNSPYLTQDLSKSLRLQDFPEAVDLISDGEIYQNTALLPNYPAYISPIVNNGNPVALIAIWHATYDQFSMEYYNLLKVISGLIQASLVRASLFMNANLDKLYFPSTKILKMDAFIEALRIKTEMKKSKIADYQLLKISWSGNSYQELYSQISDKIRTNDLIGSDEDGNIYILLSQADESSMTEIINRLGGLGGKYVMIDTQGISFEKGKII